MENDVLDSAAALFISFQESQKARMSLLRHAFVLNSCRFGRATRSVPSSPTWYETPINVALLSGDDLVPSASVNLIPRIQPICALLLNPLSLHPHPTTARHVLPPTTLQIITAHHGSQEDSPLHCSGPQHFHQARIPRHPGPYRPGWYSSYRVRVGQWSSGRPCFRSSWYVYPFSSARD